MSKSANLVLIECPRCLYGLQWKYCATRLCGRAQSDDHKHGTQTYTHTMPGPGKSQHLPRGLCLYDLVTCRPNSVHMLTQHIFVHRSAPFQCRTACPLSSRCILHTFPSSTSFMLSPIWVQMIFTRIMSLWLAQCVTIESLCTLCHR